MIRKVQNGFNRDVLVFHFDIWAWIIEMQIDLDIKRIDGRIFSGTFVRNLPQGVLFLNQYTIGKEIMVFYDPNNLTDISIDTAAPGKELV